MGVNSKGADQVMIEDQDTTISWLKTINRLSAFEIGELEAKVGELEKSRDFHINSVAKVVEDSRTIIEELETDKATVGRNIQEMVMSYSRTIKELEAEVDSWKAAYKSYTTGDPFDVFHPPAALKEKDCE